MRKVASVVLILAFAFLLSSCHVLAGGIILQMFGMEFTSQIEWWEECLSVNLEDLTDNHIKTICLKEDKGGNALIIQYIDLEGAGEAFSASNIENSGNWKSLPYTQEIDELFVQKGVYEQYGFEMIEDGYFTVSGIRKDGTGIDFDFSNFDLWYDYQVGIWDASDECLYYIFIGTQP